MALTIGLAGVSMMTPYHLAGFKAAGGVVVKAVADPNRKRCQDQAKALKARAYPDLTSMRKAEKLDAVVIATPNKFHSELALEALAAGLHVFCEKPPALNARETAAMRDLAAKKKRTLIFNLNNRARPEAQALMEYIRRGDAGRINSAQAVWMRRDGIPGFGGWFTTKAVAGGGPLIDLLHMIDLALWFMGYPEPEWALAQTFSDFIANPAFVGPWGVPNVQNPVCDVENACHGFVRFKTGQVLTLRNSWAEMVRAEEVSVTFQGTRAGGMVLRTFDVDGRDMTAHDYCQFYALEHGRQVNRDIRFAPDEAMGRNAASENFIRVLRGEAEPLATADEGVRLMSIIDAVYQSAASGEPVRVKAPGK